MKAFQIRLPPAKKILPGRPVGPAVSGAKLADDGSVSAGCVDVGVLSLAVADRLMADS